MRIGESSEDETTNTGNRRIWGIPQDHPQNGILSHIDKLVPWTEFCGVIEPHYPKAGDSANCAARSGKKSELFWGGIDNRMSTNNHYLSIYLHITTVISNGYFAIRHFYEMIQAKSLSVF